MIWSRGSPRLYPSPRQQIIAHLVSCHRNFVRWLGVGNRCLVPFTRFSEPDDSKRNHYFDFVDGREVAFMAGVCDTLPRQIRAKDPEPTNGIFYGFLTTAPNETVGAIHSKAMPAVLTTPEEWEA